LSVLPVSDLLLNGSTPNSPRYGPTTIS
jgi:hypothetical protein